jgi:hypothetical protein
VHFGLRALARTHGANAVTDAFHEDLAKLNTPLLKA